MTTKINPILQQHATKLMTLTEMVEYLKSHPDAKRLVALTAPSGAGKTTLRKHVQVSIGDLEFSQSNTNRLSRADDEPGAYKHVQIEEFRDLIQKSAFIEYKEVYPGKFYGTPVSEFQRIVVGNHHSMLLDIDVQGALDLKKIFGDYIHIIFIKPPSIPELRKRIISRNGGTEPKDLTVRLARAKEELKYQNSFDDIVINKNLAIAKEKVTQSIISFFETSH